MTKFDTRTKKQKKKEEVQIQYVPYENFITRVLVNIQAQLNKIERAQDVIKERITFEAKEKDKTNG